MDEQHIVADMGGGQRKVVPISLPGNSYRQREEQDKKQDKKIEPVVTGKVLQKKKPLGRKIAETFTGDDIRTVSSVVVFDVMIPAAKDMIQDMISEGVQRLLFGEARGPARSRRPQSGGSYINYGRYSSAMNQRQEQQSRDMSRRARATHDFDELVLEDRGEAEQVLDALTELIDLYELATVYDLYELAGIPASFTDKKWGWTSLRDASVQRIRGGYLLNLPRPVPVD